jgi:hypothetical protein
LRCLWFTVDGSEEEESTIDEGDILEEMKKEKKREDGGCKGKREEEGNVYRGRQCELNRRSSPIATRLGCPPSADLLGSHFGIPSGLYVSIIHLHLSFIPCLTLLYVYIYLCCTSTSSMYSTLQLQVPPRPSFLNLQMIVTVRSCRPALP